MSPIDWNLVFWSVWGITIQPYLAIAGLIDGAISTGDVLFTLYATITLPFWAIVVHRANRYLHERLKPSLGYSPGDRIITRGERATLIERMPAFALIVFNQPMAAECESWWALTDSGNRVGAHTFMMEHLPILDRLAEIH